MLARLTCKPDLPSFHPAILPSFHLSILQYLVKRNFDLLAKASAFFQIE